MLTYDDIQIGDSIVFSTPHTAEMRGKAVMKGPAGWVVNAGGRHGIPKIVSEANYIRGRKGRNRKKDFLGEFINQ
tara:strand:+ start:219 stop:443 length:225 start_codon:yes stop_codon:yes gene_type:complete